MISEVLERAGIPSIFAILSKRRLTWLGHLQRMNPASIPKDLLYGELAQGSRPVGRPCLRYKNICKRDTKLSGIDVNKWESYADDRAKWRTSVREGVMKAEEKRRVEQEDKRRRSKQWETSSLSPTNHRCSGCGKDCHSRIGLHSHSRKDANQPTNQ